MKVCYIARKDLPVKIFQESVRGTELHAECQIQNWTIENKKNGNCTL